MGFLHLWQKPGIGELPSGRIYSQTPDGLLGALHVAEVRSGDAYGFCLLGGEIDKYKQGHFISIRELIRYYDS